MHSAIRPFTEADRAAVVEIDNAEPPPFASVTAADWAAQDRRRPAGNVLLREVLGEPAIAFLQVEDMGTAAPSYRSIAGHYEIALVVRRDRRNHGIGDTLYQRAVAFAAARGGTRLRAWAYQSAPDDPGPHFLQRRGFAETARRQTSYLDLRSFDADRFAPALAAVDRQNVTIHTYAPLAGTDKRRRKLYDLYVATGFAPAEVLFEQWAATRLDNADWNAETLLIAEHAGAWIAMTRAEITNRDTGVAHITATATVPEWRGRGIALALKVRGIAALRARGATVITTSNRVDNTPILRINHKLGYVPGPLELTFERRLDP